MVDGVLAGIRAAPRDRRNQDSRQFEFRRSRDAALRGAHRVERALIETGQIKAGETIALLGTGGGVVLWHSPLRRCMGAYTFLTSSSEAKLTRAKTLGADCADQSITIQPDWDQEILKQTGGTGVDLVIEVGGASTLERSMNAVRPGGTICVIGALAGRWRHQPPYDQPQGDPPPGYSCRLARHVRRDEQGGSAAQA